MVSLDQACDAVDLVAAAVNTTFGIMEHCVFMEDLIDRLASASGIRLAEHVVEVAKQQCRYGGGHGFLRFMLDVPGGRGELSRGHCAAGVQVVDPTPIIGADRSSAECRDLQKPARHRNVLEQADQTGRLCANFTAMSTFNDVSLASVPCPSCRRSLKRGIVDVALRGAAEEGGAVCLVHRRVVP
jgi:hypothetical protein